MEKELVVDWIDLLKKVLARAGSVNDKRKAYKILEPVYGRSRVIAYGNNGKLSKKFFGQVCRDYSAGVFFWDAVCSWIKDAANGEYTVKDRKWIAKVAAKYIGEENEGS